MSAWMILSENGSQYQNTVEEKSPITKRCFMINKNKKCSIHAYAINVREKSSQCKIITQLKQ